MAVGAMAQHQQQQENEEHPPTTTTTELETSLSRAIQLRAPYIKGQSHQLTLASVRRLLERDLGLKNLYLEEHKAVIKGLVDKVLNETDNETDDQEALPEEPRKRRKKNFRVVEDLQDEELETPTVDGNSDKTTNVLNVDKEKPTKNNVDDFEDQDNLGAKDREQTTDMPDGHGSNVEKQEAVQVGPSKEDKEVPEDQGEVEETPALKIETIRHDNPLSQETQEASQPDSINANESAIRLALSRRAAELKSKAETLTVTNVRHLLEEDLGLERDGLKVHKQFIRTLVDELLGAPSVEPNIDQLKGKRGTEEEAPVNSTGKPKSKEGKPSIGKKSALGETIEDSEENLQGNGEVSDSVSEERRPNKLKKRKKKDNEVKTKPVVVKTSTEVKRPFSAKVERLREILKIVGIGVSPIVYKKAKQAPEHERDQVLIKELENRLAQEGLSSNPSEKEMKRVKARLEKKRDLDGIEHSNIVSESRRSRAAANNWFAPRPNRYAQAAHKDSKDQDLDDDSKPVVTGAMDD
ncbi:unnamed protein product [Calypogeia fissa]